MTVPAETQWDTSYTDHAMYLALCVSMFFSDSSNTQPNSGMVCVRSVSLSFSRYSHLLCPNDLNVCVLAFDLISVTVWAKEGFFGFPFLRPWRFLVLIYIYICYRDYVSSGNIYFPWNFRDLTSSLNFQGFDIFPENALGNIPYSLKIGQIFETYSLTVFPWRYSLKLISVYMWPDSALWSFHVCFLSK